MSGTDRRHKHWPLQRIERIVPAGTAPTYDAALLTQPAEEGLRHALETLPDGVRADVTSYADAGRALVGPVAKFFDDILVMDPDPAVRAARLGLLAAVRATAPDGVDWRALDLALGS